MPVKRKLPAKIGRCYKNLAGHNFDFRAKSSSEKFFMYNKNILSGGFGSKVNIAAGQVFVTPPKLFFLSWNKGQLRAAITWPCKLSTPLCHTYSEPSGYEVSPGIIQNLPYLSKSRLRAKLLGVFLVISEVTSQIYTANLVMFKIWVFSATCMTSHCMP